jgi:hypothetical protein
MIWDAVQGARRAEAEIVWVYTLKLRAPQQHSNAPKALF